VKYPFLSAVLLTLAAALFALSGCASVEIALRSFLFSAAEDIDRSYPATGAVALEGTIVLESKPAFLKRLFYNPAPPVPANENEIVVYFGFEPDFGWDWDGDWKSLLLEWIPPERSGGTGMILWGDVDSYYGKCDILFGNAVRKGELRIRRNPAKPTEPKVQENKRIILIVLDCATTETVSVEMNDYITTNNFTRHMPPHFWGEFVLGGRAYRIFSVVEGVYYGWRDTRAESTAYEFLRNGQKLQILDNSDTVVAELCENNYTLYGTLPQTEWDNMKQALALFHAFRYIAQGLI
jgi:hypothetical protein